MTEQLFSPAEVYRPFIQVGGSLPNLGVRVKKNYIKPSLKGKGKGSKQHYSAFDALLYGIGLHLEREGVSFDMAYHLAQITISEWFLPCTHDGAWMVIFNNVEKHPLFKASFFEEADFLNVLDSANKEKSGRIDLEKANYEFLHPLPGVVLPVHKDIMEKMSQAVGSIWSIKYINIGMIVCSCVEALGINKEEIQLLEKLSIVTRARKVANE